MKLKTLKDFKEGNKDITILGFAWSLCWRLYVAMLVIAFASGFIVEIFA